MGWRFQKRKAQRNEEAEVTKEDTGNVVERILRGEDVIEDVETAWGTFSIRFPLPRTLREIQVLLSTRLAGQNLPHNVRLNYEVYATLDVVVVDSPEFWKNLGSSEDCPYDDLVSLLYRRYLRFYSEVQAHIREHQPASSAEPHSDGDGDALVGDEPLQGVTYREAVS